MNRFVALVMAAGLFVIAGLVFIGESRDPDKVLLLTTADRTDPQLRDTIAEFAAWGYYVTERADAALRASRDEDLIVFVATWRAFDVVPESSWREMYGRHVVVGGLDVSLHELQPLTHGTAAGTSRVRYTPERAIFSMLYTSSGCGTGATSDWLREYNVAGIAAWRAEQIELLFEMTGV